MIARAFDTSQRPTSPVRAHEIATQLAIRALRCLCSIAKGLQAPVDLDSDEESTQVDAGRDLERIHTDIIVSIYFIDCVYHVRSTIKRNVIFDTESMIVESLSRCINRSIYLLYNVG